jgi:glycosyltransferase involved in cell wall biosynthesis
MRIISVQPHLRAGGSEMQTLLLSNELARRGVETHLVLHRDEGELLDELNPAVHVHSLGVESHALIPVIAARLDRVLGAFDGGLAIVKLWSSLLAVQVAVMRRRQLTYAICEDLDPLDHWRHIKLGTTKRRVITPIFRRSKLIFANTERVADGMIESYSLNRRPHVLYGGIDVERIRTLALERTHVAARRDAPDTPIQVITVASLRTRKGHPRILAGLRLLDVPWEWHIVGDGPEADRLKASIPKDLVERVHFHGAVANPYPYLAQSDVLVHLPYSEAFGIVILEALALGIPVVASPSIGPLEIACRVDPDGQYLSFVEPTESDAVADAIRASAATEHEHIPRDIVDDFAITSTADAWLEIAGTT